MNRTLRFLLLSIGLACGLTPAGLAQRMIGVVAKAQADKILLRWTPDSSALWQRANQDGYYVVRQTVARDGVALTGTTSVTLNPGGTAIKPYPNADPFWSAMVADTAYRRSMRELLYAANPVRPPVDTVDSVNPSETDLPFYRYVMTLITADQSFATAVAAGLGFVDATALPNEQYAYQITTAIPANVMTTISQIATLGLADYRTLAPVDKPLVRFGTQMATISWKADTVAVGYNTYWIERSTNGTVFTGRNIQPFLVAGQDVNAFSYQDSMPKGRRTYYYRLKGKTIFDEVGYSPVVFGQSKDTLLNAPAIKTLRIEPDGAASLSWQFPGDSLVARADTLLKGYFVAVATRAQDRPVPAQINLPSSTTSASVTNYRAKAPGGTTYYFTVGAVRLDGDTLLSSPVFVEPIDSIPPTVPMGLQGLITTQGIGRLSWLPNPEADLLGYKVFRAQRAGEEPSAVTADSILTGSSWQDPVALDFLNAGVYYQVRAIDRHYNESELSAPVYLVKPDTIRPTAPLFKGFTSVAGGLQLRWANSFSRDVVRHTLYRRDAAGGSWQTLNVFGVHSGSVVQSDTVWTDGEVQASRSYVYLLLAQDAGGLVSDSTAQLVVDVPTSLGRQQPYFSVFNAQANADRQTVSLSWSYDAPGVADYQIYRQAGSQPLGLWRMVTGLETSTEDEGVKPDTTYRYRIRASFRDGTVSNWQSTSVVHSSTASAGQLPYVALPIPAQTGTVGVALTYTVPAATFAGDHTPLTIRVLSNGLPPGLTANGAILSGTPLRAGTSVVTVQATDPNGLAISTTFALSINGAPALLSGLAPQTVTIGFSFSYTVPTEAFFDEDGRPTLVSIVATNLPPGLAANGATLSGTLSAPGPFTIGVQATDADGASTLTSLVLTGNRPPQIISAVANQTAVVGKLATWTLPANTFTDPEGYPLTTWLLGSGLPAGLSAQPTGYIGTPTTAGSYTLTARASDPLGAETDSRFVLTVSQAANIPPIATALATLTLTLGQPADYTLPVHTFFDEDGQIVRAAISGTPPPGLTVQSTHLTGIPTTAGTFTLTITGTDNLSATTSTSLVILIPAGPTPPVIAGSTSICSGQSAVLAASGCSGGTIQWSNGETGLTQTVSPIQTTTYYATCQLDGLSSTQSNTLTVTVSGTIAATITGNLTICGGQNASLTANGGGSYRWSTGAITATISTSTAGTYSVTASYGPGCSAVTSVSVISNPLPIASITGNLSICTGQSTTLTATGGATYLWNTGATTATLSTSTAGTYSVTVSDGTTCIATTSASVSVRPLATLTSQPVTSSVVCAGTSVTASVGVSGTGSFTYQWYKGSTALNGQTAATLSLTNVQTSDGGSYSVVIANSCTSLTSTAFSLTVNPIPAQPTLTGVSRTVTTSTTPLALTAFVTAVANHTLTFYNSVSANPLNPPTANISQLGAQSFSVTQTSAAGCISPATPFTITVQQSATTTPGSQTVCRSSNVVLNATTTGTRYEWYKNGQSIANKLAEITSIQRGTTTVSLTIVSIQTTASYYCKVFQANGSFTWSGPFSVAVDYSCIGSGG